MQTHPLEFDDADENELNTIFSQMASSFGIRRPCIPEGWRILVVRNGRNEAYAVSKSVYSLFGKVRRKRMPYSLGLFIGILRKKGGRFDVSLELLSWLRRRGFVERVVTLTDEGEQHALYGRDLLKSSVAAVPSDLARGDMLLLVNGGGEVLALGKALCDYASTQEAEPTQRVVKTVKDKGWYLRKGG